VPSLASYVSVNSPAADNTTLTTSSFTPTAGDILVVKAAKENSASLTYGPPTDTQSNTYTLRASHSGTNQAPVWIWTAVAGSSVSMTVSMTSSGASGWFRSFLVEDWTRAALDATPVTNSTTNGTGAPLATLTTTQNNSAVTWVNADFAAVSPSGRVYNTSAAVPIEEDVHDKSSATNYVAYYASQSAASPGSQTFGLTSPTGQTWSMVGIEILDVPGPGSPDDPNQVEPLKLWQ
jgi:hypothetical protein